MRATANTTEREGEGGGECERGNRSDRTRPRSPDRRLVATQETDTETHARDAWDTHTGGVYRERERTQPEARWGNRQRRATDAANGGHEGGGGSAERGNSRWTDERHDTTRHGDTAGTHSAGEATRDTDRGQRGAHDTHDTGRYARRHRRRHRRRHKRRHAGLRRGRAAGCAGGRR